MKKTLLLSVVASTMIMAGGDIAPAAEQAAPAAVSGWDFSGQAVVYYQTQSDSDTNNGRLYNGHENKDLFDQDASRANAGIQLRATNANLFNGIGAGVEVSGLGTLGLQEDVVGGVMQHANGASDTGVGGWISQAYLTGGFGNTTAKVGRQELPKALSPFAFSESWNVFKNTFDAALVVNTDLPDTLVVGAWVAKANVNGVSADMSTFVSINPDKDVDDCYDVPFSGDMCGEDNGVWMLTVQNKSIENLTLTGTWYYATDVFSAVDSDYANLNILWGDAKYAMNGITVGLQGGTFMSDDFTEDLPWMDTSSNPSAWGAMIAGSIGGADVAAIYTSTEGHEDRNFGGFKNFGGVKTPLYSQLILNQAFIKEDSDTLVVKGSMAALGGTLGAALNMSEIGENNDLRNGRDAGDYTEFDLTYKTKVFGNTDVFAAYVYQDYDQWEENRDLLRVWARYNF